ncbi:hypothetical protein Tco_0609330 [Tanacetum coccineum]
MVSSSAVSMSILRMGSYHWFTRIRVDHPFDRALVDRGSEEDPADYPPDRDDDDDDDEDKDEDEEEDEEHLASADSVPPVHRMTARISIRDELPISLSSREEVKDFLP